MCTAWSVVVERCEHLLGLDDATARANLFRFARDRFRFRFPQDLVLRPVVVSSSSSSTIIVVLSRFLRGRLGGCMIVQTGRSFRRGCGCDVRIRFRRRVDVVVERGHRGPVQRLVVLDRDAGRIGAGGFGDFVVVTREQG